MITREKIDVCMRGCDLMSKQMVEELVAERDEALEANEHLIAKDHDPCKLLLANERLLKEARESIKKECAESRREPCDCADKARARGFIDCYEQMKPMVEAIEYAIYHLDAENEHVTLHLQKALAQWKESQK